MELPFGIQGDRLVIKKVLTRAVLPLGDTALDLLPFLIMGGLTVAAALLLRWKFPGRQWARRLVQTLSALAFIMGVHPCACMTRDLVLGANALGRDDLNAFKYLIIFGTVAAGTMFFGRVFCGWICPLGFVQELLAKLSGWLGRTTAAGLRAVVRLCDWLGARRAARGRDAETGLAFRVRTAVAEGLLPNLPTAGLVTKWLLTIALLLLLFVSSFLTKPATFSFIEHAMVFATIGLCLIVMWVLADRRSEWWMKSRVRYVALGTIMAVYVYGVYANGPFCVFFTAYVEWASVISCFGVLLVSFMLMNAWCRYMCPEGATLGLLAGRSAWQINRTGQCVRCGSCEDACPMDCITEGIRDRRTCIYCMRCVDACPADALELVSEVRAGQRQTTPYVARCLLEPGGVTATMGSGSEREGEAPAEPRPAGSCRAGFPLPPGEG